MALDNQEQKSIKDSLFGFSNKKAPAERHKQPSPADLSTKVKVEPQAEDSLNNETVLLRHARVVIFLAFKQKDSIDDIAKRIMRRRGKNTLGKGIERERICTGMLIRALVDIFLEEGPFQELPEINTEEEAKQWLKKVFSK